jgi:predicted Zn-dependent protease with MMP-like domain
MYKETEQFEDIVAKAFTRLPKRFRSLVKNVALLTEDTVSEQVRREMNLSKDKDLLGLYRGVPRTKRHNDAGFAFPDTITLYRLPIERRARATKKTVFEVVYETLWHEIGHHFGLGEEEVRKREKELFGS